MLEQDGGLTRKFSSKFTPATQTTTRICFNLLDNGSKNKHLKTEQNTERKHENHHWKNKNNTNHSNGESNRTSITRGKKRRKDTQTKRENEKSTLTSTPSKTARIHKEQTETTEHKSHWKNHRQQILKHSEKQQDSVENLKDYE